MLIEKLTRMLSDRYRLLTRSFLKANESLCISLWNEFKKPPYGGGNQFMMALERALKRQGILVVHNVLSPQVDIHICNSAWFDIKRFEEQAKNFPIRMIHRIDGPVGLYRGTDETEDRKIHSLNKKFASATVYQSEYSLRKSVELGFNAVKPRKIIGNAVDADIFHSIGRRPYTANRKIKLITAAWSDNPRKGGPLIGWLDNNLDWSRFEYTFVGNVQQHFENITHIPPQESALLAEILRDHDIFVFPSEKESCSNALLEALSCGLPALYRDDGGNPEIVKNAGVPFHDEQDVLIQLDSLMNNYLKFQRNIELKTIDEIANEYVALASYLKEQNN
jgi:glycosyltransferase involved in cell wall biosynthesis